MPPPTSRTTEIALTGMRFQVLVGILPHEREIPQPLEIDLRVGLSDAPAELLDYRALYAIVLRIVGAAPLEYLETVGGAVVTEVLLLPAVAWVRVAVRKPHVALGGPLDHAEVVVEGTR